MRNTSMVCHLAHFSSDAVCSAAATGMQNRALISAIPLLQACAGSEMLSTIDGRLGTCTSCTTICCCHAECTELHLGSRGIQRLHGFEHFVNLESLWLNNNRLQALNHLDANFRIRELYVHDNSICTLKGSLRCFKFLSVLDLSNNRLCNLQKVAAMLATFMFLQSLNLSGNPCCQEVHYRLVLIHAIPSLVVLDLHMVKKRERDEVLATLHLNAAGESVEPCRSGACLPILALGCTFRRSRLLFVGSRPQQNNPGKPVIGVNARHVQQGALVLFANLQSFAVCLRQSMPMTSTAHICF